MTDNVIKSTDVNKKSTAKKTVAKKTAPAKDKVENISNNNGFSVVIFESGSSYSSGGYRFTRDKRIQEVPNDLAEILLQLDNFRLPTQTEVDEFIANKEV